MSSAWGKSWGRSWGNSWGSVGGTTQVPEGPRPSRRRKKTQAEQDEQDMKVIGPIIAQYLAQNLQ